MILTPPVKLDKIDVEVTGFDVNDAIIYANVYKANRFHNAEGLINLNNTLDVAAAYMVTEGFVPKKNYLVNAHLIT